MDPATSGRDETRDERADAFSRMAREHSLDGMILMGVDARHAAIASLVEAGIPSVGFDIRLDGPAATWVASDNRASGGSAVDHLAADGYGLVGGIGQYEDVWRMAYVRGPEGIIVSLAERIG